MEEAARLSAGSYGGKEVNNYTIDPELSNRNRTTYVHNDTGKATIAYRGTDLSSKKTRGGDLGTDALLALGLQDLSARFRNAKKHARNAVAKYGVGNVDTVGHSLGGSQSLYINSKLGLPSTSFNPGVSPGFARKSLFDRLSGALFKRPVQKSATIYSTLTDGISTLSPSMANAKTVVVPQRRKNPHSIRNFM